MKKFVILFALVAFASAAPAYDDVEEKKENISIVEEARNLGEDGSYDFSYQGSDGSAREESASIDNKDTDEESLTITGSYRYIDANNEEVVVNYTAGKDGFVPTGTHIAREISEVAAAASKLPKEYDESDEPKSAYNAPRQ